MQLSCPSDKFESGGGRLKRLVYKHALCTFSTSRPLLRPPNFCFGSGILWCRASGTRTVEHFSNICAQTQAKLTLLEARRSQSFDRMPVPSTGFRAGCTERLLCLAPARLWWVRKQTGWTEGQTATWERTEVSPTIRDRHWHRTPVILSCWPAEIKVFWSTGLVGGRGAGLFSR